MLIRSLLYHRQKEESGSLQLQVRMSMVYFGLRAKAGLDSEYCAVTGKTRIPDWNSRYRYIWTIHTYSS